MGSTNSRGKSNWVGFMQEAAAIRVSRALFLSGPAATDVVVTGPLGCAGVAATAELLPLPLDLLESNEAVLEALDRPRKVFLKQY